MRQPFGFGPSRPLGGYFTPARERDLEPFQTYATGRLGHAYVVFAAQQYILLSPHIRSS